MNNKQDIGGVPGLYQKHANKVEEGCMVGTPTSASTQVTGTGASDYNVDVTAGIVLVNGKVKEFPAQADFSVAASATEQMAALQSRVYSIVALENPVSGAVSMISVPGPAALTTDGAVALTDDEIDALYSDETAWIRIADVTVNRTGATTVTQSQDNTVRQFPVPKTMLRT